MALAFLNSKSLGIVSMRKSHFHSYTEKVTPPTCTEKGYTTYICSCGNTKKDNFVDALGHDYDKAYKCNEQGHWKLCKRCGEASKVEIHFPDRSEATNTDPIKCVVCGYIIQEALCSHDWGDWILNKQATCVNAGSWSRTCLLCGGVESKTISHLGHQLSSTIITPATCSTKGERYYSCSRCGYNYIEDIPATGNHVSTHIGEVASTCTKEGSSEGEKCVVCNTFLVEPSILPLAPHNFPDWSRNDTEHWKECADCGAEEERGICDKDGLGSIAAKATCTNNEWKHIACSVCGRDYTSVVEIPGTSLGHIPQESVKYYSKTEHRYTKVCTRCLNIIEIRNERHKWITVGAKRRCEICGHEESLGDEIPL